MNSRWKSNSGYTATISKSALRNLDNIICITIGNYLGRNNYVSDWFLTIVVVWIIIERVNHLDGSNTADNPLYGVGKDIEIQRLSTGDCFREVVSKSKMAYGE